MGRADAVLAASVFHDGVYTVAEVKAAMAARARPSAPFGRRAQSASSSAARAYLRR